MSFLFGHKKAASPEIPKEKIRTWTRTLEHEKRRVEREAAKCQREEDKLVGDIKKIAKKHSGQSNNAMRIYAKTIVQSRKNTERLLMTSVQLNSMVLSLKTQAASMNVAGHLQKSTDVMQKMSKLVKLKDITATCSAMSKEMAKMGLIDEMMEESIDSAMGDEDLEAAADEEVDRVVMEITQGELGKLSDVKRREAAAKEEEDEKETQAMKSRFENLKI
jgi:charged multivesicular body protein 3